MARTRVQVTIWPVEVSAARFESLRGHLSPDERAHVGRLRSAQVAREFVVSRGVARELLASLCGVQPYELLFGAGAAGKPCLMKPAASFAFNLSHSAGYCALAVGDVESLGVDIEAIRDEYEDIAPVVFGAQEAAQFDALPEQDRAEIFSGAFVAKEAYLKATGQGLAGGLASLELDLHTMQPIAIRGSREALQGWAFHRFGVAGQIAGAVAVEAAGPVDFEVHHLDAETAAAGAQWARPLSTPV